MVKTSLGQSQLVKYDFSKKILKKLIIFFIDPSSCVKFTQLLLVCISEWAVNYAITGNSLEPTKFKQTYMELLKSKVKFPQKNTYFQKKNENLTNSQIGEKKVPITNPPTNHLLHLWRLKIINRRRSS